MRHSVVLFLINVCAACAPCLGDEVADANTVNAVVQTPIITVQTPEQLEVALMNKTLPVTIEKSVANKPVAIRMLTAPKEPVKVALEPSVLNVRLNTTDDDEGLPVEIESDTPWWSVVAAIATVLTVTIAWRTAAQNKRASQVQGFHSLMKDYASPDMGQSLNRLYNWGRRYAELRDLAEGAINWAARRSQGPSGSCWCWGPDTDTALSDARRKVSHYFGGLAFMLKEEVYPPWLNNLLGGAFLPKTFVREMWDLDSLEDLNRVIIALEAALLRARGDREDEAEKLSSVERILQTCWKNKRRKKPEPWTTDKVKQYFFQNDGGASSKSESEAQAKKDD